MPSQSKVSDGSTVVLRQHDPGVDDRGDADRQVDQEDPVPRGAVDQRAADDRAEDRAEQHRDAEHGHHATDALRTGGAGQDRHAERHQHAAAEALEDPVEDEQLERGRGRAQHGAGREEEDGEQVEALGAEAVGSPAGQRDDAGEGEGVAGHRPRDLGRGGVELLLERVERDGHDGDVEDRHDGAEDDDAGHHQDVLVELVGVVRLGLAGLELGVGHPTRVLVASDNDRILLRVRLRHPEGRTPSRSSIRARLGPRTSWIRRAASSTSRITRRVLRQVSRARSSADQPRSARAASRAG